MKSILLSIISFACGISTLAHTNNNCSDRLFNTSKCFDMIASLQYFDKLKDDNQFKNLANDSMFIQALNNVNENVTASKLCNLYATFNGSRNNTDSCVLFFQTLIDNVDQADSEWITNIIDLHQDLSKCITDINNAGYSEYWETVIKPELDSYINSYPVSCTLLDSIHSAMTEFSGPEELSETYSNTYVINIDNAFNLADESFCCTPLLLNPEMEKHFKLDFLKVYTHENLHRLYLSEALMKKLEELKADDFYRDNEEIAAYHREGLNEAFVVAAEVFISHQIGRRDDQSVYDEFKEYIDGSLVLAPIIYVHLNEKRKDESLNDFVLRLFSTGILSVGSVKTEYDKAMSHLQLQIK